MKASVRALLDQLDPPLRRQVEEEMAWSRHLRERWREHSGGERMPFVVANKPALLRRLAGEQNWRCCHCGSEMHDSNGPEALRVTFEHIIPRSLGGSDDPSNLAAACFGCNNARGSDITWTPPDAR